MSTENALYVDAVTKALTHPVKEIDSTASSGVLTQPSVTDNGDGTVTVSTGEAMLRAIASDTATTAFVSWSETILTPANNAINYIYLEYNGGNPQMIITTIERDEHNTNVFIAAVYRYSGTFLHITPHGNPIPAAVHRITDRLEHVDGLSHEMGGEFSEVGTRNIAITAATFWLGLQKFDVLPSGFDSSGSDSFYTFYRDGSGGWTVGTAQQVPNNVYDDGSGVLAPLVGSHRGVFWFYIAVDGDIYMIYGRGDYNANESREVTAPIDLPPHMEVNHATLAAKVIVQNGSSTFEAIASAFAVAFGAGGVADHGDLIGLGDDDHTQYLLANGTRTPTAFVWPSGATGSRPGSPVLAQVFFDTTLGIPIWYNGTNWVNALGTIV